MEGEPSFAALDHLAHLPVDSAPLRSVSGPASASTSLPALSPQRRPRSSRTAASASDSARNRARTSDASKANHSNRDGPHIRSKFFVEVPAPSFILNKRKRKRGEEKETKERHRNDRARKRRNRLGPEAPVPDARPVGERLLPEYLAEDLDGTLRPVWVIQGLSFDLTLAHCVVLFCGYKYVVFSLLGDLLL
jgi:hypothetical protein